jgi:hypothetical protein
MSLISIGSASSFVIKPSCAEPCTANSASPIGVAVRSTVQRTILESSPPPVNESGRERKVCRAALERTVWAAAITGASSDVPV